MIAFTVMLAFTGIVSSTADAKRGGIKSPRQGYTQAPKNRPTTSSAAMRTKIPEPPPGPAPQRSRASSPAAG